MFDRRTGNPSSCDPSSYDPGVKDFLTGRQRRKFGRLAVLLSVFSIMQGCSSLAPPSDAAPPPTGVDPGYIKLVATYMKNTFKQLSPTDVTEISTPRWVESEKGWTWLSCVHFIDHGRKRTYALFFNQTAVVDARYAVLIDGCSKQTYSPVDMSFGARPGAIGDTGPLY
jgi:hypothetical protein